MIIPHFKSKRLHQRVQQEVIDWHVVIDGFKVAVLDFQQSIQALLDNPGYLHSKSLITIKDTAFAKELTLLSEVAESCRGMLGEIQQAR